MAFWRFASSDKIVWPLIPLFIVLGSVGGWVGASLVIEVDDSLLKIVTGIALISFAPLLLFDNEFGTGIRSVSLWSIRFWLGCCIYFLLMIFGGFFGPGIGILFILVLTRVFGLSLIQAIATDNLPWLVMSLSSVIVFAAEGLVDWGAGLFLLFGMSAGGWIGADRAVRYGEKTVKKAFVGICVILGALTLFGYFDLGSHII